MDLPLSLATLAGMHILMAMLPGPNTVLVGYLSATRSRRAGLCAAAGVVTASMAWVVLALYGVGALLMEAGTLYRVLRLLGALYLLYVGIRMLRAGLARPAVDGGRAGPRLGERRPFVAGLLTTLSNPKSAVFWTSAFLVAVPPGAPGWFYGAILLIVLVQSTLWYGAVALILSTGFLRERYLAFARHLDTVAGVVMIALGLRLAEEVRRELLARATS